ncbi:hypothetical protein HPB47_001886 [Ixodes persulcatus]|uniref:Uncharacterized protein n=1 Tax=Ixodes persulcatus TaxID=34615 RepID=A0AC60PMY8_IXOPE|nr:hypothetical protein HPB47_001886 [Ixodes persulcatus]
MPHKLRAEDEEDSSDTESELSSGPSSAEILALIKLSFQGEGSTLSPTLPGESIIKGAAWLSCRSFSA